MARIQRKSGGAPPWPGVWLTQQSGRSLLGTLRQPAFGTIGTCRVHIEIDDFDPDLPPDVAGAAAPRAVAKFGVGDLRQRKAAPVASRRQPRLALAGELEGECLLLVLRMTEQDRTDLARIAAVHAEHRFPQMHRLFKQAVVCAWHGISPSSEGTSPTVRGARWPSS